MRSCPLSSIHHTTFDIYAERKVGVHNRLLWYIRLERVSFGSVLLLLWLRAVQNICPSVVNTTRLLILGRVFFSLRSTNLRQSWYDRGGRPCTAPPYLSISMVASIKQLYHLPTLTSSVSRSFLLLSIHRDCSAGSFCFSTRPTLRLHRSADVYHDRRLILPPLMCLLLTISYHSFSSSLSPSTSSLLPSQPSS